MKLDDICLYRFFNDTEGENWKKHLDKIGIVYKDLRYDPETHEMENVYKPISTWVRNETPITTLPLLTYLIVHEDPSDAEYYLTKTAVVHRTLKAIKEDDALI